MRTTDRCRINEVIKPTINNAFPVDFKNEFI